MSTHPVALTPEQLERIHAQLATFERYACPDCLPVASVVVNPGRWSLTLDHTPGCQSYALNMRHVLDLDNDPQEGSTDSL